MGWLKHILLGDIGQSIDIVETSNQLKCNENVQRIQRRNQSMQEMEIARLKARTERLHLAVTALSRYLVEKNLIAESEFRDFLDQIDGEDGKSDGRLPFVDEASKPRLVVPPSKLKQ
jgi:hypothetical protein